MRSRPQKPRGCPPRSFSFPVLLKANILKRFPGRALFLFIGRISEREQTYDADVRRDAQEALELFFFIDPDEHASQVLGARREHQVLRRNARVREIVGLAPEYTRLGRVRAEHDHQRRTASLREIGYLLTAARASSGIAAAAGRFSTGQHTVDDRRGAADTGVHRDGPEFAVHGAGPAFHAEVPIRDSRPLVAHHENSLRTDLNAPAAACAFVRCVLQSRYIRKIFHTTPHSFSLNTIIRTSEMLAVPI